MPMVEGGRKALILMVATMAVVVAFIVALLLWPSNCSAETESIIPDDQWNANVKLWLARSLIGEVGWRITKEHAAVAWVYAMRANQSRRHDFLGMVKRYSAAVRNPGRIRNPWLFELGLDGARPGSWPYGPLWKGRYQQAWFRLLQLADLWRAGKIANPCPGANHFGGPMDRHRAENRHWYRVKCKMRTRNSFYDSRRIQPRRRS
jgi:hypothetical protein